MKSVYLRAGLALLCAVILSACGGGNDGNMVLSGTITGLTKPGLVLVNKPTGEKLTIAANATSFQFTRLVAVDEQFDVQIDTPPNGAVCVPSANANKANIYTAYYVVITCTTNPFALGGSVTGLVDDGDSTTNDGVTLANGPDTVYVGPAPAGTDAQFAFAGLVGNGSPYGVTVLAQPANRTCAVTTAGPGIMPNKDYKELVVTCTKNN